MSEDERDRPQKQVGGDSSGKGCEESLNGRLTTSSVPEGYDIHMCISASELRATYLVTTAPEAASPKICHWPSTPEEFQPTTATLSSDLSTLRLGTWAIPAMVFSWAATTDFVVRPFELTQDRLDVPFSNAVWRALQTSAHIIRRQGSLQGA